MSGGLWCVFILMLISLLVHFFNDGEMQDGIFGIDAGCYNFKLKFLDTVLWLGVLYWAGLFDKIGV